MSQKPKYLYHGSSNQEIELLEPRAITTRNPEEGAVIFAIATEIEASKFIVPSDDSWSMLGAFTTIEDGIKTVDHIAIYADQDRFMAADKGGAIYKLPSEKFILNTKYGPKEWTSVESVKPISKVTYDSGLKAMLSFGVKVYFVDKATLDSIRKADDLWYEMVKKNESV